MENSNLKITYKVEAQLRPCTVQNRNAMFHRWIDEAWVVGDSPMMGGHKAGQIWHVFGLVEFEDTGRITKVEPEDIVFVKEAKDGELVDDDPC